jgi:hypothetical protein
MELENPCYKGIDFKRIEAVERGAMPLAFEIPEEAV